MSYESLTDLLGTHHKQLSLVRPIINSPETGERELDEPSLSAPVKEKELGPDTLPIKFTFAPSDTPLGIAAPHTFMHGLFKDGNLYGPYVSNRFESSLPRILAPDSPEWNDPPAFPPRSGNPLIKGLRKLMLVDSLSHGRVWDAFRAKVQVYQTKLLFFEESVIVKTTDPSRFPVKAPLPGVFTEKEARLSIFQENRIYTDYLYDLQGEVVPGSYGLWGGRLVLGDDDDEEEDEETSCEIWAMILEDVGEEVDVTSLSEDEKQEIVSHYREVHKAGVLHGDPDPRHWRRHPAGGFRIIDFDSATVLPPGKKGRALMEDELDLVNSHLVEEDRTWYI
ncbi:hypothetical protein I312_104644 [Cryptococcus bacillisporus CA1280]|uniref:Protein kinase domain-containing protein n=1 Tax=Cryptococcus bacillisporus CA1280 TaxID=1296109 RepID=A0A0D0VME4_CRYGA|nr:hypothetical protein I312_04709 [Cryptococcus bacillisporus CA1280]